MRLAECIACIAQRFFRSKSSLSQLGMGYTHVEIETHGRTTLVHFYLFFYYIKKRAILRDIKVDLTLQYFADLEVHHPKETTLQEQPTTALPTLPGKSCKKCEGSMPSGAIKACFARPANRSIGVSVRRLKP